MRQAVLASALLIAALAACADTPDQPAVAPKAAEGKLEHTVAKVNPPAVEATAPANYPGLHNVVTFFDGVYSGSVPEGPEGFETLEGMGIQTIISVDGAPPEVELARQHGMRYVHLPITYSGIEPERQLELARAIQDLPGPIYLHCHHGKHRSAGAAGFAAVSLGRMSPDQAAARMKVAGTAPNYAGLYACVADATTLDAATLAKANTKFPEVSKTTSFVQRMVEIDHEMDSLKAIEKAGWKVPAEHPDLVPTAVAGQLEHLFRELAGDSTLDSKPEDFHAWLSANQKHSLAIEEELMEKTPSVEVLAKEMKAMNDACKQCHTKYRD